jgi:molecular chaperone HtpG
MEETDEEKKVRGEVGKEFELLCKSFKDLLGEKVTKVSVSDRVTQTPCIITTDAYGWTANMERIMKAQALRDASMMGQMGSRKTLEINTGHVIMKELKRRVDENTQLDKATKDLMTLMYESAVLHSGFTLDDPSNFVNRMYRMVEVGLSLDGVGVGVGVEPCTPDVTPLEEEEESGSQMEEVD